MSATITSTVKADIDSSLTFFCRCGRKAVEDRVHLDGTTDYACKKHGWVASIKVNL